MCQESLKVPKCLPCVHTFCLECLEQYGKGKRPGDELACPLCRQLCKIPAGGLQKLPVNFFIEQMLDANEESAARPGREVTCDRCFQNMASGYCVDCARNMCDACLLPHRKLRATISHKILKLNERQNSRVSM